MYEDTFIETVNNISGSDNFYTQVMFSGSLFEEDFSMKKVNPSKPKLGLLGMFSDSDFFTVDEVKKFIIKVLLYIQLIFIKSWRYSVEEVIEAN